MSTAISNKVYERMYFAYSDVQTYAHVAKVCDVSWVTAKKYIVYGDPDRQMEPIIERYRRTMRKMQGMTEEMVARDFAELAKATIPKLDKLDSLIHVALDTFLDHDGALLKKKLPRFVDLVATMRSEIEIRRWLFEVGEAAGVVGEAKDWTPAELLVKLQDVVSRLNEDQLKVLNAGIAEYKETGEMPDEITALLMGREVH